MKDPLPSRTAVWLATSIGFTSYLFSIILDSNISWEFSSIFDDSYNFLQFPQFNSLSPPRSSSISHVSHLYQLISHKGLNVFEPVGMLWKAGWIDLIGLSPISFRALSACNHVVNGLLLYYWLHLIWSNSHPHPREKDTARSEWYIVVVVTLFLLHPLNMEVIGWLSAFSYIPALSMCLISSIALEKMINLLYSEEEEEKRRRMSRKELLFRLLLLASFCYAFFALGSLCKAPAIMLAVVHTSRCLWILLTETSEDPAIKPVLRNKSKSRNASSSLNTSSPSIPRKVRMLLVIAFLVGLLALFALVLVFAFLSNRASNPDIHATALTRLQRESPWLFLGKVLKAMRIFGDFVQRAIFPNDLRIHYQSPSDLHFEPKTFFTSSDNFLPGLTLVYLLFGCFYVLGSLLHPTLAAEEENDSDDSMDEIVRKSRRKRKVDYAGWVVWGLSGYVGCWLPGSGLVHHGWSHLGGDRYNYLPLAYVTPALLAVACWSSSHSDEEEEEDEDEDERPISTQRLKWRRVLGVGQFFSLVLISLLLMLKSRSHLMHYSSDELLLEECIAYDGRDWECLQDLGDWSGRILEQFSAYPTPPVSEEIEKFRQQYDQFNRRAMKVIEEDYPASPRLHMFLATLQVSLVSVQAGCKTVHQVLLQVLKAIHSQYGVQWRGEGRAVMTHLDRYLESNSSATSTLLPREKVEAFFTVLTSFDILEAFNIDLLPMTINNAMTCHLVESGLSVERVQKEVLPVFDEALRLIYRWNQTEESKSLLSQSNLWLDHVSALTEHRDSLKTYVRTGGTTYQAKFLH